jgi:phosphoglycolate phosphatase
MNIFCDLDGTLIDSRARLYELFSYLVPCSNLSFDEYWGLKRNQINHRQILIEHFKYSESQIDCFEKSWMSEIELKKWLDLDCPFESITDFLVHLNRVNNIYLVTARQNKQNVHMQLKKFGWSNIFVEVLVTEQKSTKIDLIKNLLQVESEDWIVGDTGKDVQTGRTLGIKTAAVLSGFLNENSLLKYSPDIIVDNFIDLKFS